jgi:hypothetical protein
MGNPVSARAGASDWKVWPGVSALVMVLGTALSVWAKGQHVEAPAQTIEFAGGAGSSARVERRPGADGGEVLHGETVVATGGGARCRVVEDATLDARGRLVGAVIVSEGCGAPERVSLDAVRGTVRWGSGEVWRAPTDKPWVYEPPRAIAGRALPTPVAAWVTLRAAALGPWARVVRAEVGESYETATEQIASATEVGVTAVVGDDGADADAAFVERVRIGALGVVLVRTAPLDRGGFPPLAAPRP